MDTPDHPDSANNPLLPAAVPAFDPPASPDSHYQPAPKVRLRKFFEFLLRFWWVPVTTVILAVAGAVRTISPSPATFVSRGRMWETVKLRLPEGSMFSEDMQNFLGTQSELLESSTLRDLTLGRLRAASNSVVIPVDKNGEPLAVNVRISQAAKSAVFVLEATGSNPSYTRAYLNAIMDAYLEYKKNVRQTISGDTLASITEQVQRAERDLKTEQDVLSDFQKTNNPAILQEEGTIAGGYLARLKTQLSDLQLENRLVQATAADAQGSANSTNANSPIDLTRLQQLTGAPAGSTGSEAQTAYKELEWLKLQRAKLSRYLRPKHPKIVKLDADIEHAEKMIEIYRRQNREQLAAAQEATRLKIENVQSAINEWETKVVAANTRIAEAERLKLNVQRVQSVYDRLVLLVQNVGISRNIDQETLSILERASASYRSRVADKNRLAMLGVCGLGFGLAIVFLLALRDDRFGSVMEVCEKLGDDAVVGQVPEMTGQAPILLEQNDDQFMYAESYRSLRSALLFPSFEGQHPKVILITSALPHEGKSTVAANLARTLAMGDARVLLIDADLRRGTLHSFLGLNREPGLAQLLRGEIPAEAAVQSNAIPTFRFIPSGSRAHQPR